MTEAESSLQRQMILHFDLDAFYAAVEVLLDPSLAGKPVIIGADPHQRGVVSTASYEARAFGVHSAMPIGVAYRLCPDGIYLRPRHDVYREHSRQVFAVVSRFSGLIQPVSIDEAFVGIDGTDPVSTAKELKAAIRAATGLTVSVGLSTSKQVSKIASDLDKPDGFVAVPVGSEAAFLAPLKVSKLWGVGPRTGERLTKLGITTIGELACCDRDALINALGQRFAESLLRRARGEDDSQIVVDRQIKSISDENTFQRDEADARKLWEVMSKQCTHCAERLVRYSLVARTVTVKLRYADFTTITRSVTLAAPTDDAAVISSTVISLMRQSWSQDRRPLRLVGVRVSNFISQPEAQQSPRLT